MAEKEIVVFVTWSPQTRVKGSVALTFSDEANTVVARSKPGKLDVRPGDARFSSWKMPLPSVPGMYRADVMVENVPIWRGFVRITP